MFRYTGGQTVKHGFYWNARTWQITLIEHQGGTLPGDGGARYARVPVVAMLLLAPIMGAAYVMFLPFIGFAMVLDFLARRVARGARAGALTLGAVVVPSWRPGEAYLAKDEHGKDEKAKHEEEAGDDGPRC
jgi:hypothetical protein